MQELLFCYTQQCMWHRLLCHSLVRLEQLAAMCRARNFQFAKMKLHFAQTLNAQALTLAATYILQTISLLP